jgi:hypothetical protein
MKLVDLDYILIVSIVSIYPKLNMFERNSLLNQENAPSDWPLNYSEAKSTLSYLLDKFLNKESLKQAQEELIEIIGRNMLNIDKTLNRNIAEHLTELEARTSTEFADKVRLSIMERVL